MNVLPRVFADRRKGDNRKCTSHHSIPSSRRALREIISRHKSNIIDVTFRYRRSDV